MLRRLTIDNFALISHIEVQFDTGLSIITGETGAGKSIIIGALSLLLGAKTDVKQVKSQEKKVVVEAVFDISKYDLKQFFVLHEIDFFPKETFVRREILPSGRSRSFVNDTPVSLAVMSSLTETLIDIHSQHSNALLLKPSYQLSMLDDIAGDADLLQQYKEAYRRFAESRKEYDSARERIEKNRSDEEYFRFQLNQLESADLKSGEQEELEHEKVVLDNLSQLKESLSMTCSILAEGDSSAVSDLTDAIRRMNQICGVYKEAPDVVNRLESAKIDLQDIYDTLSRDFQNLGGDASDLDAVEDRLSTIYTLQQKFHLGTVDDLLKMQSSLRKSLAEIDNSEDELAELQRRMSVAEGKVTKLAGQLTLARQKASETFLHQLQKKTEYLGLGNFKGEIEFVKTEPGPAGQDKVQLLVAFNKKQNPIPIEGTASGGEVSRLMLCVKTILAEKMQLPTIIFDEVDTGVSGEIANKIGSMMKDISENIQVVTITHLPQVAALGNHHYRVFKVDEEDGTRTSIKLLDERERVLEVARMLSGATVDAAAIANAESLIRK